jgi:DNA-binding response OmpR family regulator
MESITFLDIVAGEAGIVLVVDDDERIRRLVREFLESEGHDVIEAADAADASRLFRAGGIDCVLLDVMMPGTTGVELCRQWKSIPSLEHVPVLLLTGLSDRNTRLAGIDAGANDFLTKPFDPIDLRLRVRNAIHTKRLYDRLLQQHQQKLQAAPADNAEG